MRSLAPLVMTLLVAAPAAAQEPPTYDVVVLSVGGDAPAAVAREAREAVAAALAGDALRVYPEGELALRMPPSRLSGCDSVACAWALGRELRVSMVAAVATWQGEDGPASVTVSLIVGADRSYAASEDVGEGGIVRAATAASRGAQNARGRALLVEGSAAPRQEPVSTAERTEAAPIETPQPRERGLEEYVLPALLGVTALALTGAGVYALLPQHCDLQGPSGVCLRGDDPNVGVGVVLTATGGLAIAGAILWMILGGMPPPMRRIDVVLGPNGGSVGWRGTF